MDKSVNQSRLSRNQLPPQEAGNVAVSLDQLTDLDQAINLSRGATSASTRPTPVISRSTRPKPASKPSSSSAPALKTTPKSAPSPQEPVEEKPAVPVRSAKEAINAMYSSENPARLSDYLGASAKDIINAAAKPASDSKSAASLHHASSQRKMEAARPSASALFRATKSETTVVHTSLELDPKSPRTSVNQASKQPPVVISSRSRAENSRSEQARPASTSSIRPKKGQIKITTPSSTSIAVSAIEQAAGTVTGSSARPASKSSPKKTPAQKVPRPAPRPRGGLVQDIARPARPNAVNSMNTASSGAPSPNTASTSPQPPRPIKTSSRTTSDPYQKLPTDSVKRRFRLAPKGFAASKPEQARPARRKFMSFSNPDYSVPIPKPTPAVDIYGMTEPEPAPERGKNGLGVVEDYRPNNPSNPAMGTSASDRSGAVDSQSYEVPGSPKSQKSTPDNNRYSLGGQSPFFLKSVSVEKRPLSDAPTRRADTISPIYTDPGDELPKKNVYDGKSKFKSPKSQKSTKKSNPRDLPQRPTVIIPANRRSHAPLFLLLILTVILGAAVGAAVYFFFFQ